MRANRNRSKRTKQTQPAPKPARPPIPAVAAAVALAVLTLVVYWQALGSDFVNFDDDHYVTERAPVLAGLTMRSVTWALTDTQSGNWHPLTWLSHMLDVQIFGLHPMGHHLTSLLLHIAGTLLLFAALRAMTGQFWKSWFVAALFAIHPLHVESVAWVSERKDVLSAFFWMLTMLAYAAYVKRPKLARYLPVLALFALGLMAKPMLVSLPVVLLLLDWWPLRRARERGWKLLILEKAPMLAIVAASSVVTMIAQRQGLSVTTIRELPLNERVANSLVSYAMYLVKAFWPAELTCYYPFYTRIPIWWPVCSAIALTAICFLALRTRRVHSYLGTGWLWYGVSLFPVIGIVQVGDQSMADRYSYIPLIGIFIMVAWGVPELAKRIAALRRSVPPGMIPGGIGVRPAAIAGAVIILALSAAAYRQVGYWKNSITLFEHALKVTGDNPVAHNDLGAAYRDQGELSKAAYHFAEAARIRGDDPSTLTNLSTTLIEQGRFPEAMRLLNKVLEIAPNDPIAHNALGGAYAKQGRYGDAIPHYLAALRFKPGFVEAMGNLAAAYEGVGNVREAARRYEEAIGMNPRLAGVRLNYGVMLCKLGKSSEGQQQMEEAIRIDPNNPQGYIDLAMALYYAGDYAGAWRQVRSCREHGGDLTPGFLQALSRKMTEPVE